MGTRTYTSSLLAISLAMQLAGCFGGRAKTQEKITVKPRANKPGQDLASGGGKSAAPSTGTPETSGSTPAAAEGSGTASAPPATASTATDDLASSTPSTETPSTAGTPSAGTTPDDPLAFIGTWNGAVDDIPSEYGWGITNVALTGAVSTTPSPATPGVSPTVPSTTNPASGSLIPNDVTFVIPAGTRANRRSWNEPSSPVRVRVGGTLTIRNEDSVPHTLHTNGAPFPHGDTIPQGGSSPPLRIEYPFNGSTGELYEHDDAGGNRFINVKFYLRAE